VRTGGVTAIWPRSEVWTDAAFVGIHSFNGNGEMTGWAWIAEQRMLASPICITNTHLVGVGSGSRGDPASPAVIGPNKSAEIGYQGIMMTLIIAEVFQ
jgi:L-aminopeptidase/D-esterase-like protein